MTSNSTAARTTSSGYMRNVILITTVTAVGGFLFGFDNGAISGSTGKLTDKFDLSPAGLGWVTSSMIVGCIIGVIIGGRLSDMIGRRRILVATAIIFLIGAAGEALAPSAGMLVAARILVGIGIGIETTIAPLYIAEVAPARIRGRLVSFNQLFNTVGNLAIFTVATVITAVGTTQWNIDYGWRWIFAAGIIPAIIFLLLLRTIPESPRWLVKKGKVDQARLVLGKINPSAEVAEAELASIQTEQTAEAGADWRTLFRRPELRTALIVGFGCALFQQITGINAIFYYAPEIFESSGLSTNSAMISTVVTGGGLVVGTLLAMWLIDKVGRRTLLIAGSILMAVFHTLIGLLFLSEHPNGMVLLVLIVGYVLAFATTFGAVAYVVIAELFPTHVRGLAASICIFALWGGNFLVSQFFPILVDSAGTSTTFFIFAGTSVAALIFTVMLVPETKGRTLEQIQASMRRSGSASVR